MTKIEHITKHFQAANEIDWVILALRQDIRNSNNGIFKASKNLIEKNLGSMIVFSNTQFFNLFRVHFIFVAFCSS